MLVGAALMFTSIRRKSPASKQEGPPAPKNSWKERDSSIRFHWLQKATISKKRKAFIGLDLLLKKRSMQGFTISKNRFNSFFIQGRLESLHDGP